MTQEVIDATELKRLIEESSSSPMIVPGTDVDGKRRATRRPRSRPRTSTPRKWKRPAASSSLDGNCRFRHHWFGLYKFLVKYRAYCVTLLIWHDGYCSPSPARQN